MQDRFQLKFGDLVAFSVTIGTEFWLVVEDVMLYRTGVYHTATLRSHINVICLTSDGCFKFKPSGLNKELDFVYRKGKEIFHVGKQ